MTPEHQYALELIGPDQLKLNDVKDVYLPGPYQVLAKVEAVGLCFSDLKLLKQFDKHARKGDILDGIDKEVLKEIPSYKPNRMPTVPGHEACCKIIAAGDKVTHSKVGQRVLVQTDYRWLPTDKSNGSFGYNFEGGLQQYVLLDERVIVDPQTNESFLIPVNEDLSSSAVGLVEPWACVESSYITRDRNRIQPNGKLLIVADAGYKIKDIEQCFSPKAKPSTIFCCCADDNQLTCLENIAIDLEKVDDISTLENASFTDIVYFGCDKKTIERLSTKLSAYGLINIILASKKIGSDVSIDVGRIHYGQTRWTGTVSDSPLDGYKNIPQSGELRDDDKIIVIGAAGPMGQMHVIRQVCSGKKNISIVGTDFDDDRLDSLKKKTDSAAQTNNVKLDLVNPKKQPVEGKFSYHTIMAPIGAIVASAIKNSLRHSLINVFAGIPAGTVQEIDLDTYISNKCYMFGTSGSRLVDMMVVLKKVTEGSLDTNLSVDAVSGMAGAIDGIRAVENRLLAGKIVVYPALSDVGLIKLSDMAKYYPTAAEKFNNGLWTKEAEEEFLNAARK